MFNKKQAPLDVNVVICPICHGDGSFDYTRTDAILDPEGQNIKTLTQPIKLICKQCNGVGLVWTTSEREC